MSLGGGGLGLSGVEEQGNVTLYTSMGDIEIELYWMHAPKTCKNFYELAKRK